MRMKLGTLKRIIREAVEAELGAASSGTPQAGVESDLQNPAGMPTGRKYTDKEFNKIMMYLTTPSGPYMREPRDKDGDLGMQSLYSPGDYELQIHMDPSSMQRISEPDDDEPTSGDHRGKTRGEVRDRILNNMLQRWKEHDSRWPAAVALMQNTRAREKENAEKVAASGIWGPKKP
jgi:hypothetical protein